MKKNLLPLFQTSSDSMQTQRPPGQKLSKDSMIDDLMRCLQTSPTQLVNEDKHWQEIESRMEASNRGGEQWISVGKATSMSGPTSRNRSHGKEEELELGVALYSENENQYLQNDTDSGRYGNKLSPHLSNDLYGEVIRNSMAPTLPQSAAPRRGDKSTDGFVDSLTVQDSFEEMSDQNKDVSSRGYLSTSFTEARKFKLEYFMDPLSGGITVAACNIIH